MNRQSRAFSLILPLLVCLAARLLFAGSSENPPTKGGGSCNLGDPEIMAEIKKALWGRFIVTNDPLDCAHMPLPEGEQ